VPEVETVPEEAEVLVDEEDVQGYPDAVVDAAREVLSATEHGPVRLSVLLTDELSDDVAELVMLSALWAFAPDPGDPGEKEIATEVDVLAGALVAEDDGGAPLRNGRFGGSDLLLARRGAGDGS
jgi:hypothetical protein